LSNLNISLGYGRFNLVPFPADGNITVNFI
jgi:hypothetical protein